MSNRTALLGKKLGMSQVWDENGFFVPVTLVDVSTNVVTAVKSEESDGYKAVQLGYGQVDPTKVTKPLAGHFAKAGVTPRRHLAEVRTDNAEEFEPGQELTAELFPEGTLVDVTGTTKGKVVEAPPKELELLNCLASHPNRVYTRDQLLDEVWGFEYYGDSRTIDVHVKRLREKLAGASDKWELKTVWGVGYKFEVRQ